MSAEETVSLCTWKTFPLSGFFSQVMASYNFVSVVIAIDIMERTGLSVPSGATIALDSAIYGGAIAGMFMMGYVGDRIGRASAMNITLALMAVGGVGSGAASWGSDHAIYACITGFRFILGFGLGGTFPLTATSVAERSAEHGRMVRLTNVGIAYTGQGVGYTLPYVFVYLLWLGWFGNDSYNVRTFEWRSTLIMGGLPALLLIYFQPADTLNKSKSAQDLSGTVATRLQEGGYLTKLAGTGGVWFVYDVLSFGVKMFAPSIVEDIFNDDDGDDDSETLGEVCWQNIALNLCQIPAMLLTIYLIPYIGHKKLLVSSFIAQLLCFLALGCVHVWDTSDDVAMFAILCFVYFFQGFGCGMCNFILAAESYPMEVGNFQTNNACRKA